MDFTNFANGQTETDFYVITTDFVDEDPVNPTVNGKEEVTGGKLVVSECEFMGVADEVGELAAQLQLLEESQDDLWRAGHHGRAYALMVSTAYRLAEKLAHMIDE